MTMLNPNDPEPPSIPSPAIHVDNTCQLAQVPGDEDIIHWSTSALREAYKLHPRQSSPEPINSPELVSSPEPVSIPDNLELSIRIVTSDEITELNHSYRHKNNPTNVLSFPFELPPGMPVDELPNILGDIAICAEVVAREADQQHKSITAHWAHMVVHGTLHLLGYDHQNDTDAAQMEALEIHILQQLDFPNPYLATEHQPTII